MKTWNKEDALKELQDLANYIDSLKDYGRTSTQHTRWCIRTLNFLREVFGQNSLYFQNFSSLTWRATGRIMTRAIDIQSEIERRDQEAFIQQIESAKGLLLAAWDELSRKEVDEVYEGKDTAPESSTLLKVINLTEHKLRKLIREIPKKELEIQDSIENLFIGADILYSRENESIEYSSKTYRPDFTIKQLDLAIDVKLCAREGREKEIIAEINDDILAYQTKFGNLLFVVYDVGQIRDSERFTKSFEAHDNVMVRVIKH